MKGRLKYLTILICCIVCGCTSSVPVTYNEETWTTYGDADWAFDGTELVATIDSGAGFVMTNVVFETFLLHVEFFPDDSINSGVFIHCQNSALSATDCYEINIWDHHPNQEFRTGAVVMRAPPLHHVATVNQWNEYRIRKSENRIQAWINDTQVVDLIDSDLKRGQIALQASGSGSITFRNIAITVLEPDS